MTVRFSQDVAAASLPIPAPSSGLVRRLAFSIPQRSGETAYPHMVAGGRWRAPALGLTPEDITILRTTTRRPPCPWPLPARSPLL